MEKEIYEKAVHRLERRGIKDPTAQIVALEEEIDYYRERIGNLLDHIRQVEKGDAEPSAWASPAQKLTERRPDAIYYIGTHRKLPGMECASTMRVAAVRDVLQRLAEYEDTGLDPEQVAELRSRTA